MTPSHHPDADELIAYAAGTSPEWTSLVVACHLTYCPECRESVELLDGLGGVLLDQLDAPDAPTVPTELGSKVDATRKKSAPTLGLEPDLPRPLHDFFEEALPHFRFLAPGVQHIPLSLSVGGVRARVVKFKPGFTIPEHSHTGLEMVLVLDGELADTATREIFRTGDSSRREEGNTHSQHVTSRDPCVCLVVSTAPIVPTSMWGKVLKMLTGV